MKRGVLFILLFFLLGMIMVSVVCAGKTYLTEDLGRNALAKKEAEGWKVYTVEIKLENDWAKLPALTAGETTSLTGRSYYYMEHLMTNTAQDGACPEEIVYLEIYRDDELYHRYEGKCDVSGDIKFDVGFAEPGYYGYKIYTAWQMENDEIPEGPTQFFVRPATSEGEDSKSWIVVDFAHTPSKPEPGEAVIFTDRSNYRMVKVASWHWDFGDGANSTERDCEHTYNSEGTYTVVLTLETDEGESYAESKEITVQISPESISTEDSPATGLFLSLFAMGLVYLIMRGR